MTDERIQRPGDIVADGEGQVPSAEVQTVMVVDDTPANLKLLRAQLRRENLRVIAFPDGPTALAAAKHELPDLILLDINMPGMDGFEVCRALKADKTLERIPVLFISARGQTSDKVQAFAVGGVDYITKPFEAEEVLARVRTHLTIRRQELLLERSLKSLRELEILRDRLVNMVVHDLRSPLTGVQAMFRVLQEDEVHERRLLAGRGLSAARRMARLVNAMLDMSTLESGGLEPSLQNVDLGALLQRAVDELTADAGKRTVRYDAPDTPIFAECDPELIARVAQNLLANANEHTDPDSGKITLRIARQDESVRIEVEDNGPGVDHVDLDSIFEKYAHRLDRPGSHGLGLAFSKMAVEAHGGEIGVTPAGSRGSVFWFTLPGIGV